MFPPGVAGRALQGTGHKPLIQRTETRSFTLYINTQNFHGEWAELHF